MRYLKAIVLLLLIALLAGCVSMKGKSCTKGACPNAEKCCAEKECPSKAKCTGDKADCKCEGCDKSDCEHCKGCDKGCPHAKAKAGSCDKSEKPGSCKSDGGKGGCTREGSAKDTAGANAKSAI
ncbi:MAG: hypothetical protein J5J00_08905 [Deltaproteobacteria bacterium]|nr:hypothetical protein [Deltaproteobacteria bacterium]